MGGFSTSIMVDASGGQSSHSEQSLTNTGSVITAKKDITLKANIKADISFGRFSEGVWEDSCGSSGSCVAMRI